MTIGPVQLVVLGFTGNTVTGDVLAELRAVREKDIIRLLSLLFVHKDTRGAITQIQMSDLAPDEAQQLGALAGGLIGQGMDGSDGANRGAETGMLFVSEHDFGLSDQDIRDIARDIPAGTGAAIALFEHHWAVQLKEQVLASGGFVLAQGMVQPSTLLQFGAELAAAEHLSALYEQL